MHSLKPWIGEKKTSEIKIAEISKTKICGRAIAIVLALCLAGVPQAFAQSAQSAAQDQAAQPNRTPRQNPNSTLVPDPSKGPLQPAATQPQDIPTAPSATNAQPRTTVIAPQDQPQQPAAKPEPPLGAAAAEAGRPAGGLASKPAGNAIAPAKQRQVRSLLIKVGAIAAGAAALGIVYGLTRATPSTPPGAGATTTGH